MSESINGSNEEDAVINTAISTGVKDEHLEFEDETLQITDVHAFNHTDCDLTLPGPADFCSTSKLWNSNLSPTSAIQTSAINTVHSEAQDLQSEFAALGFDSLCPSVRYDLNPSFDVSFEQQISFTTNENMERKTDEGILSDDSPTNFSKSPQGTADGKILEDHPVTEINNSNEDSVIAKEPIVQEFRNSSTVLVTSDALDVNECGINIKQTTNTSDFVEKKSDESVLTSEESNDVYVDAVDSFISNKDEVTVKSNEGNEQPNQPQDSNRIECSMNNFNEVNQVESSFTDKPDPVVEQETDSFLKNISEKNKAAIYNMVEPTVKDNIEETCQIQSNHLNEDLADALEEENVNVEPSVSSEVRTLNTSEEYVLETKDIPEISFDRFDSQEHHVGFDITSNMLHLNQSCSTEVTTYQTYEDRPTNCRQDQVIKEVFVQEFSSQISVFMTNSSTEKIVEEDLKTDISQKFEAEQTFFKEVEGTLSSSHQSNTGDIGETYQNQRSNSDKVSEEGNSMEIPVSQGNIIDIQQFSSMDVLSLNKPNESSFMSNTDKTSNLEESSGKVQTVENISSIENEIKKDVQVKNSKFSDVVYRETAIEESIFKDNHQENIPVFCTEEIMVVRECVPKEMKEEIHATGMSILKDELEDMLLNYSTLFENNANENYYVEDCSSSHASVEITLFTDAKESTNNSDVEQEDCKEISEMDITPQLLASTNHVQLSFEGNVHELDNLQVVTVSGSEYTLAEEIHLLNNTSLIAIKGKPNDDKTKFESEETLEKIFPVECEVGDELIESKISSSQEAHEKSNLMEETCLDEILEEAYVKEEVLSGNEVNKTFPAEKSSSEIFIEEILLGLIEDSMSKSETVEGHNGIRASFVEFVEETHCILDHSFENNGNVFQQSKSEISVVEEPQTEKKILDKMFESDSEKSCTIDGNVSFPTDEQFKKQTESESYYRQQNTDMSLTIVGASRNNLDLSGLSSESYEEKCKYPEHKFSQTINDLLNSVDTEDMNEFTDTCHQKTNDALYIPSLNCDETNYSLNDNGSQNFMEITMANSNVMVIEQNLSSSSNQAELSSDQSVIQEKEGDENSTICETQSFSEKQKESISPSSGSPDDQLESNIDLDYINSKNHKLMQQSMSDYVTNQSLKLAIPDSSYSHDINCADEETRKQCEEQTENVLLMKWPAQYHNDIKTLKQQNDLLSECSNQKDTVINELKKEKADLLNIISELTSQSLELNLENENFRHYSVNLDADKKILIELRQENVKLKQDLEVLKNIESEFFDFKIKNEELITTIDNNRLAKECEINALKSKIEQLEHELLTMNQTVSDLQSRSQEVCILVDKLQGKDREIESLKKDKCMMEESVLDLNNKVDELMVENEKLNNISRLKEEKLKDMDNLTMLLEKQSNEIRDQNEKLLKLAFDLNEKEQHIKDLFTDKLSLEQTVSSLNDQLNELRKLEDENHKLKSDLVEEKDKREEILSSNKSLEENVYSLGENISKLNNEILAKDSQISALMDSNAELKNDIETLHQKLDELKQYEKENKHLKCSMKEKDEEFIKIKTSAEEQVSNLKAQNELLWNQLKASYTKEQNMSSLKEEKLLLEEQLIQIKREIQSINNLKSDNEHLVSELISKDAEISSLIADKKKLKSSLKKAGDKLNEKDSEIETLSELIIERDEEIEKLSENMKLTEENFKTLDQEKGELQNELFELRKSNKSLEEELAENIGSVSEYLSSVFFENVFLSEKLCLCETEELEMRHELQSLKEKILEERMLYENLHLEKENLSSTVASLKQNIKLLAEELDMYKIQCKNTSILIEENVKMTEKVKELNKMLVSNDDEKICLFGDMSSLSETICSLLVDGQLLTEQKNICSEMSENIALLTAENHLLEQQISQRDQDNQLLIQNLQNQLESVGNKDKIVDELRDFSNGLENHISSMNEEMFSEISKNQYLTVIVDALESKLTRNKTEIVSLHDKISTLTDQMNKSKESYGNLQELVMLLENHISSLNEELMSEITKNHLLSLENENLMCQQNNILENNQSLQNIISEAVESIRNKLGNNSDRNGKPVPLLSQLNTILHELHSTENENLELSKEISTLRTIIQNNNESLNDLLSVKQNIEMQLSSVIEQKLELENKLVIALAKESDKQLDEDYENLLNMAEAHKSCEDVKSQLQNEKLNLEAHILTLTQTIEEIRSKEQQFETQRKENLEMKEVMSKEIYSLTGELWNSEVEPLIVVFQKLMKEFLTKEKEVIFSLQSEFGHKVTEAEGKIVNLRNALDKKEFFTSKLEKDLEDYKVQLNDRDNRISCLESELLKVKNDMSSQPIELVEFKITTEKEKKSLLSTINSLQLTKTELEEKISHLSDEINVNNKEILLLKENMEKLQCEKEDILRKSGELSSELNEKQELISQLNLQLNRKNNEISHLTESVEKKETETRQCLTKIEEMQPAIIKLQAIEHESEMINKISSDDNFDMEAFNGCLNSCKFLGEMMQLVLSKLVQNLKQLQMANNDLKLELSNQIEINKSLETQVSDMNEELKSCKLLYDEDFLQFKEEIASKNLAISNLTESLEQLKKVTCMEADLKIQNTEVEKIKEDMDKLKEENIQLKNDSAKMDYLTKINRKLSWEIEELSRTLKSEKQSNIDLKAKCTLATCQVAELSKKNFQLEDKIEALEKKLKNGDVISSLQIEFPAGINTVDAQAQYLSEKMAEFKEINCKVISLNEEYGLLKHEYEKSKEYIKKQEEKICKIMKRELELKKQIASHLQNSHESKILKEFSTKILSFFPGESLSLDEALEKVKVLIQSGEKVVHNEEVEVLKQKIEELTQENKDLDVECEMMNKHIKEQEELLASVFKREEDLKKLNAEMETLLSKNLQTNIKSPINDSELKELFELFSEKPTSLKESIDLIKVIVNENQSLKEKISESQEDYANLDKECEDMFKAYKEKEKDLADVLKREADSVSSLKNKQEELENELKALSDELETAKSQLTAQKNTSPVSASCQCEELKTRVSELKVDLAERNAKITALELQIEADNFPLKKKVADLEKSLDQAKHKINELKCEVRRYQEQMCDNTVGLRAECERCRGLGPVDPAATAALQQQLQEKTKEIHILKALCKTRNQRIKELEEIGGHKPPRSQRSALKEVQENKTVPSSPTKTARGSLH